MSQPKQFRNYEKEINRLIEELYKRKELREQTSICLLQRMYEKHFCSIKKGTDKYKWAEGEKSNFSNAVTGRGRTLSADYIIAIEKVSGMSFCEILSWDKKALTDSFNPHSLRYAAHCDDPQLLEQLLNERDADDCNCPLMNFDEFGKSIIDYILDYKAEKSLRFLIEREIIRYDHCRLHSGIYNLDKREEEVWSEIFRLDDKELLEHLFTNSNLLELYFSKASLEKILKTNYFLDYLLATKSANIHKTEFKCISPIVTDLLDIAIEQGDKNKTEKILSAYESHVNNQINEAKKKLSKDKRYRFLAETTGKLTFIRCYSSDEDSILFAVLDFNGDNLSKEIKNRINALSPEKIIQKLDYKTPSELLEGETRMDYEKHVMYIKPQKTDKEFFEYIELVKYMQENGFKGLPHLYSEKNGVFTMDITPDYHHRFSEIFSEEALIPTMKLLGEFHRLCEKRLGKGMVYLFGEEIGYNVATKYKSKSELFFTTIPCCIGDPIEDIVSLILEATSIRRFVKNNSSLLRLLQKSMKEYGNKEVLSDFSEKFEKEIDKRIPLASKAQHSGCISNYEELYLVKAFINMNKNELNKL